MFVEIHEYLAARKTNTMALADRYAFIKAEIEALNKELEQVRKDIKDTGVERLVGERAIVEVALSERSTLDTKAAKEFLTADQIAACTKVTLVETLRIKPNLTVVSI
jgi:hypothetical protein